MVSFSKTLESNSRLFSFRSVTDSKCFSKCLWETVKHGLMEYVKEHIFPFNFRSSHRRCSFKKVVLKNVTKFTGKPLCQSLFFNKVAGLRLWHRWFWLWHRCFPVNFAKFLRTPFLQNTHGRLFLIFGQRKTLAIVRRCPVK